MEIITLERRVLQKNDEIAEKNRELFKEKNISVINLLSSPGSGKTSIIEKALEHYNGKVNISIIVGDVQTANDAKRIDKFHVPVVQIITSGTCHLNSSMVSNAIRKLKLDPTEILIIENVGNLVCPSSFDLGEDKRVVVFSTTEGTDKPLKYPAMFHKADVVIINKIDLLPYTDFSLDEAKKNVHKLNPKAMIFEISCTTGEGIGAWCEWLLNKAQKSSV
ncbi:hydantoin utilization protein A [bacterium SM23_31]|nr:MAG: hydantoin utilization protein A [bacterium SM23_31]